jgi:hypothetical protein
MRIRQDHVHRYSPQRVIFDLDDQSSIPENRRCFCDLDGLWLSASFRARDYQWKVSQDTNGTDKHNH